MTCRALIAASMARLLWPVLEHVAVDASVYSRHGGPRLARAALSARNAVAFAKAISPLPNFRLQTSNPVHTAARRDRFVRRFEQRDIPPLVQLHRRVFGVLRPSTCSISRPTTTTSCRSSWTIRRSNPAMPSLVYEDGQGRPVGFLGVVPRRISDRRTAIPCGRQFQFIVAPDTRVGLVALKLAKEFLEGPPEIFRLPTRRTTSRGGSGKGSAEPPPSCAQSLLLDASAAAGQLRGFAGPQQAEPAAARRRRRAHRRHRRHACDAHPRKPLPPGSPGGQRRRPAAVGRPRPHAAVLRRGHAAGAIRRSDAPGGSLDRAARRREGGELLKVVVRRGARG